MEEFKLLFTEIWDSCATRAKNYFGEERSILTPRASNLKTKKTILDIRNLYMLDDTSLKYCDEEDSVSVPEIYMKLNDVIKKCSSANILNILQSPNITELIKSVGPLQFQFVEGEVYKGYQVEQIYYSILLTIITRLDKIDTGSNWLSYLYSPKKELNSGIYHTRVLYELFGVNDAFEYSYYTNYNKIKNNIYEFYDIEHQRFLDVTIDYFDGVATLDKELQKDKKCITKPNFIKSVEEKRNKIWGDENISAVIALYLSKHIHSILS